MNFQNNIKPAKTALALAVANALALPAVAQEGTSTVLEEVVITATKRETSLQDTPVAVTAVSGDMLTELGIQSSVDLPKVAPGLKVTWQGPFPSFNMRGGGVAGLSGAAVPLYTDGLAGGTSWAGWFDLERVEVMRGPQGTLYGGNTLGGLVNLVTRKPDTGSFDYGVSATVGEYDYTRLDGFINVPLGEKFAVRLTASKTDQDPLIENDFNSDGGLRDEDNSYIRAQFLWTPTENMDLTVRYTKWDNDSMGNANFGYHYAGIPINPETGRATGFSNTIDPRKGTTGITEQGGRTYHDSDPSTDPRAYYELQGNFDNFWDSETETLGFEFFWDVGFADLIVRGRHTETDNVNMWDVDANRNIPGLADGNTGISENDQIDVVLNSKSDGAFRWGLGYYWSDSWDGDDNNGTYLFAYVDDNALNADTGWPAWGYWDVNGSKSQAVYANAEYDLTDALTISGGIRRQEDSARYERFYSNYYGDQSIWGSSYYYNAPFPFRELYTEGGGRTEFNDKGHTDYKLALNYALNNDMNIYGSFSTGYIPNAISGGNVLDPNELDAYEVGFKSILADGTVRLNVALYRSEYEGLSYTVFEQQGSTILSRQETGGSLTSQGMEVELLWQPTENLTINSGLVIDDTELEEYALTESRFFEGPFNEEGGYYPVRVGSSWFADGDPDRPVPTPTYILDGQEASYSPDYIINLDVMYRFEMGSLGALVPGMTVYHQDDFKTMNEGFAFAEQDSYTTVDLRASWETPIDKLIVKAYLNNATDEVYKVSQNVFSNGRIMADYGRQRHWGLRVGYNF